MILVDDLGMLTFPRLLFLACQIGMILSYKHTSMAGRDRSASLEGEQFEEMQVRMLEVSSLWILKSLRTMERVTVNQEPVTGQ